MTDEKMRAALERMVAAWDELPGGRHYGPKVIASWLETHMTPAIHRARQALATPTDQPATGDGAEDVVEATIDRMIDAGVKSDGWPGLPRDVLRALARAALSTAVVPGMVMVPREPTEAMLLAGGDCYGDSMTADVWEAMLSAVPTPEGE